MTGSIRAFVANQVNVAISPFLGLKFNILRFDSNVPPQCRSFIIVHCSNSHNLYWIYALLSRNQPCRDYALWKAVLDQNLVGGGTKTFYWTGTLITCFYFQIAWFLLKCLGKEPAFPRSKYQRIKRPEPRTTGPTSDRWFVVRRSTSPTSLPSQGYGQDLH